MSMFTIIRELSLWKIDPLMTSMTHNQVTHFTFNSSRSYSPCPLGFPFRAINYTFVLGPFRLSPHTLSLSSNLPRKECEEQSHSSPLACTLITGNNDALMDTLDQLMTGCPLHSQVLHCMQKEGRLHVLTASW